MVCFCFVGLGVLFDSFLCQCRNLLDQLLCWLHIWQNIVFRQPIRVVIVSSETHCKETWYSFHFLWIRFLS